MSVGAIMGGFMATKSQDRKEYLKALEKAKAFSPETAKTIEELGLKQSCFNPLETIEEALNYWIKKGKVVQIGAKYYLN